MIADPSIILPTVQNGGVRTFFLRDSVQQSVETACMTLSTQTNSIEHDV